jgi:hypothetical protein
MMDLTDFHAKYYAHELTRRRSSDSMDKLAGAVASARVDLNPHQVDAALFGSKSFPLSPLTATRWMKSSPTVSSRFQVR